MRNLLIAILLLMCGEAFSQDQHIIDSLKEVIADVEAECGGKPCDADTGRINAYLKWGDEVIYQNVDSALSLNILAKEIADMLLKSTNSRITLQSTNTARKYLASSLNNIGYIYKSLGVIPKALESYTKSLSIQEELDDKYGMAGSFNNIGAIYFGKGNIPIALKYTTISVTLQEEIGDKRGMGRSFNNLGAIYKLQGDIPKALEFYNKSLICQEQIGDKYGMAYSYSNIGSIYSDQGEAMMALEFFLKSLNIRDSIGDKRGMASSFNKIGTIYKSEGNIPKALEYINKGLILMEEIGDKYGMALSLLWLGSISYSQSNIPKAEENFEKSLNICSELEERHLAALNMVNLGGMYQQKNNFLQFEKYSIEGYEISKELGYPKSIEPAASLMKDLCFSENKFEKADSFAYEAININDKAILSNFSTLSESSQEKYFNKISENYMDFNSYAFSRKLDNPEIINVVYNKTIKNKGILLKSSTAMRNAVLNSNDSSLIDNYYKWINLKKQIAKQYGKGQNTDSLDNLANDYEKDLVKGSKIFSDYNNLQNINWQIVQKGLRPNEAAIEFIHFKFKNYNAEKYWEWTDTTLYCALILTPESKLPKMIPLFEEKQLQVFISNYSGNNYQNTNSIYGKNNEFNGILYSLIWKPLESYLEDVKTVYLSPTGLLHKISFAAIAKEENVFLCDSYNIEIKSSTGSLANPEAYPLKDNMSATLFGGVIYNSDSTQTEIWKYLNGTKAETEKIEDILNNGNIEVDHFSGSDASEKEFKEIASASNILHISTHGFFFPDPVKLREAKKKAEEDGQELAESRASRAGEYGHGVYAFVRHQNPLMRSGLVLAGANDVWNLNSDYDYNEEDGVLTAQEVAHLDMRNTDLVVMSACETGLGDIRGSEGVYGLQRAFKMAGVKYIIMSLWQVADKETEEFMTSFYKKLIIEKDVQKAFSETQREMRQKYDPYFWAAFVLVE